MSGQAAKVKHDDSCSCGNSNLSIFQLLMELLLEQCQYNPSQRVELAKLETKLKKQNKFILHLSWIWQVHAVFAVIVKSQSISKILPLFEK